MSSSPTAELTAEEEADLLAVYGTHNPFYDELLQLQAPSQYRSIYESRNLFLTTGDDDGVNRPATSSGSIEIDALDCVGPLDLFVLRHLNSGSVAARPSSYSDALTLAVESLQGTQFSDGSGAGPLEQCRNAISAVEGGMNIHWALSKAEGGDDADAFDRELQQLIADAESEINHRNFHYDPATDPVFQARLKELQERELTPLNDEAFEDDGELLDQAELATIEAAAEERCRLAPVLLPDEAEELAQLRANDEIAAVKKAKNLDMHKVHMDVMEKLGHEERSKIPRKDSDEIETIEALLEKIKTIDLRDAELQEHAKEEVRRVAAASAHLVAEDFHQEHQQGASSKGLVVFEDIAKKIDKFFPPPADISESYTTSLQQQGASGASLTTKQSRKTLQDLRKASARLEVLAKFEAVERRLMRDEEERVNAWQRNIDAQRIAQSNDRDALTTSEDVKRRHILGEEAVAHVEVLVREERQRNNLVQLLQQRHMHQRAMVMSELSEAYDQIRSSISNVEAYEWTDLSSSERSERQALLSHALQIEEMLREMERTMILEQAESIRVSWAALLEASQARTEFIIAAALTTDAYGDRYPNTFESSALQRLAHCDSCGFGTRCEQLIAAAVTKSQWTQSSKTETATALQALGVALHAALIGGGKNIKKSKSFRASPPPPRTPTPPMTPLPTSVKDSDSTCVKLNDRLARKLLPFQFAAAAADVVRAPQVFHLLSFALESIEVIDFLSLSTMFVQSQESTSEATNAGKSIFEAERLRIAPYVKSLDLSSNSIAKLDVDALMETFPSLATILVSSNQLGGIDSIKPSCSFPTVTQLDVSANQLSQARLGLFPNLRKLYCFTNKLVDFNAITNGATCLHEIEMSRNAITSLNGSTQLPILGTLDLSRNQLTSIDELRSAILLQKLFLSCNKISQFPASGCLLFLRQLFLNENALTEIPECIAWLPLLSDLHLESNAIRSLAGLKTCQQLVTLKMAFNQLRNGVDDIKPLAACKRLRSLSLNDNPMMLIPSVNKEVELFVLVTFPLLREWNTDTVSKVKVERAHRFYQLTDGSFTFGLAGMTMFDGNLTTFPAIHRFTTALAMRNAAQPSASPAVKSALSKVPLAFAQDAMFDRLQKDYDGLKLSAHRKYQLALSLEENFKTRLKERGGYLLGTLFMQSDTIEQRNYVASLQQSQKHLEALRETVSLDTHMNTHMVSQSYERRAKAHKEAKAKQRLSEWVVGRLLIRKAVAELEILREASEIGRMRRVLKAVLKIQPLMRGALIRKRLRAVRQMADDDDDDEFQKVSFDLPDHRPLGFSNFNSLLQGAMLSHPQAPQFTMKSLALSAAPLDTFGRVSSAPTMTSDMDHQRPQSHPVPPRGGSTSQVDTFTPTKSARTKLDDEWGSALADQLRKKQAKMNKAQQSAIQKVRLTDPLLAKKLMSGSKN